MFDIIYNPAAGRKKTEKCLKKTEDILDDRGVDYRVHGTTPDEGAAEICKRLIDEGSTDIIVMGGDGTLSEALNGFHSFDKCNLGLIPCGTGNDFAVTAGIPLDTEKAVDAILIGTPVYTDFMEIGGRRGINVVGTGIDVEVLKRYNRFKHKRKINYMISLIISLFRFKFYKLQAKFDGEEKDMSALIAAVANGKMFGGGIHICPDAKIDDGMLDVLFVENLKKRNIPGSFLLLLRKKITRCKFARFERVKEIEIVPKEKMAIDIDGELIEDLEFKVKVVHETLKMYRPV